MVEHGSRAAAAAAAATAATAASGANGAANGSTASANGAAAAAKGSESTAGTAAADAADAAAAADPTTSHIRTAVEFLREADGLLRIEDILPFFPDFVTIDNFQVTTRLLVLVCAVGLSRPGRLWLRSARPGLFAQTDHSYEAPRTAVATKDKPRPDVRPPAPQHPVRTHTRATCRPPFLFTHPLPSFLPSFPASPVRLGPGRHLRQPGALRLRH